MDVTMPYSNGFDKYSIHTLQGEGFGDIIRKISPFVKQFVQKEVVPRGTKIATDTITDLINNKDLKESLKANTIKNLTGRGNSKTYKKKKKKTTKSNKSSALDVRKMLDSELKGSGINMV